jgi:DNA-binding HxlR family transcriptional regulator
MNYTHLMVTDLDPRTSAFCETLTDEQDALAREMLERVAAKWPLGVLHVLAEANGPLRFSRVLERVDGISQKMLTQTLRMLEGDGLVTRTLYPQVPPRVEYELTLLGGELLRQIVPLWRWIVEHLPAVEAARRTFDNPSEPAGHDRSNHLSE